MMNWPADPPMILSLDIIMAPNTMPYRGNMATFPLYTQALALLTIYMTGFSSA